MMNTVVSRIQHMHRLLEGGFTDDTRPESSTPYGDKTDKATKENSTYLTTGIGDKKFDAGGAKQASGTSYTKSKVKATDPGFYN